MSKRMDEIDEWIEHDLKMRDIKAWVCLSLASAFCILGLTFGFSVFILVHYFFSPFFTAVFLMQLGQVTITLTLSVVHS